MRQRSFPGSASDQSQFRQRDYTQNGKRFLRLPGSATIAASGPGDMNQQWNRHDVLKGLVAASTSFVIPRGEGATPEVTPDVGQVEIQITPVSPHILRLSIRSLT